MNRLTGANTTCFVCGNDYSDREHIEYCLNSPNTLEPADMDIDIDQREISETQLEGLILSMDENAYELSDLSLQTPAMDRLMHQTQQRIERAIRGAIRAGYDGVDINYRVEPLFGPGNPDAVDSVTDGIASIEPLNRPEPTPDSPDKYRTERYTWDWFSDDELTRLLTDDEFVQSLGERSHR